MLCCMNGKIRANRVNLSLFIQLTVRNMLDKPNIFLSLLVSPTFVTLSSVSANHSVVPQFCITPLLKLEINSSSKAYRKLQEIHFIKIYIIWSRKLTNSLPKAHKKLYKKYSTRYSSANKAWCITARIKRLNSLQKAPLFSWNICEKLSKSSLKFINITLLFKMKNLT